MAKHLRDFADGFKAPRQGCYITRPALADERGVVELPAPVPDPLPKIVAGAALTLAAGAAITALIRQQKRKPN